MDNYSITANWWIDCYYSIELIADQMIDINQQLFFALFGSVQSIITI